MEDSEAREQVAQVEALLEQVEGFGDPAARELATELVGALLDLYGEGLARMLAHVGDRTALAGDELVSHLLLLHGIHPWPVEERVRAALAEVRPYLDSHGGDVELVEVAGDRVRLRLQGSCSGCPSSAMTLKLAIEDAIHKHAPEIDRIDAGDAEQEPAAPALIQLAPPEPDGAPDNAGRWATVGALPQLRGGGTLLKDVGGEPVLFCGIEDAFYAYRPGCPGCGETLAEGALVGSALVCGSCGERFDVTRAGRSREGSDLHLEPVPLLEDEAGLVRVALAAPA
jgi:Fe-S cluster biogenesis protein NfuA/nitrite reductase/ring-hydroxylating ferredoxin subunit